MFLKMWKTSIHCNTGWERQFIDFICNQWMIKNRVNVTRFFYGFLTSLSKNETVSTKKSCHTFLEEVWMVKRALLFMVTTRSLLYWALFSIKLNRSWLVFIFKQHSLDRRVIFSWKLLKCIVFGLRTAQIQRQIKYLYVLQFGNLIIIFFISYVYADNCSVEEIDFSVR